MEKPHKRLLLWQDAMNLVMTTYQLTRSFPIHEEYGFISQMRRASTSIPVNIAEGAGRQSKKEFIQFLYIARGSLSELDTHLELSKKLGYLQESEWAKVDGQIIGIDKMVNGLIKQLRQTMKGKK